MIDDITWRLYIINEYIIIDKFRLILINFVIQLNNKKHTYFYKKILDTISKSQSIF